MSDNRAEEDAKWAEVGRSTDFDGMVDFADTPAAAMFRRR